MFKEELIKEFIQKLKSNSAVRLAYLFGSSAQQDTEREPRDVDIALLFEEGVDAEARLHVQLSIADEAERIFGRRADVVILNKASPFMRFQVLKKGLIIYEKVSGIDKELRFRTMTDYFESRLLQDFFYSRLLRSS